MGQGKIKLSMARDQNQFHFCINIHSHIWTKYVCAPEQWFPNKNSGLDLSDKMVKVDVSTKSTAFLWFGFKSFRPVPAKIHEYHQ